MIPRRTARLAPLALLASACIISSRIDPEPVPTRAQEPVRVTTPVKAHLLDGSTVVYPNGVVVVEGALDGLGMRYSLSLRDSAPVAQIALDSVVGMETYRRQVNAGRTLFYSAAATAGAVMASIAGAVALFGSCPTFYADTGDTLALEAEGFSYSVAPIFEARDVDRLRVRAGADGRVRLHVWNEALETHYINHLALLETRHAAGETALPDARNQPLVVGPLAAPARVTDRTGRDVRAVVAAHDGRVYETDETVVRATRADDLYDHVDATFAVAPGADSAAVVLRLRNSLLNTVLFYDRMLAAPGARSLDWLGRDLDRIGDVASLGRWYASRLGMRVSVWDGAAWRDAARLADAGPIAFRDVAAVVPVPAGADSLRVRLSFVADQWRIDRLALARATRRPAARALAVQRMTGADGRDDAEALAGVRGADERYLVTTPGQRFVAHFDAGAAPAADSSRTFLLVSQGYYIEWVRGAWIASARDTVPFTPSDSALAATVHAWQAKRATLERSFYAHRVPVR